MKIYPTALAQAQASTGATATANTSPTAKPWTRVSSTASKSHATNGDSDGDTKAPSPTAAGSISASPTAAGSVYASPTAAGGVSASPTAAGNVYASPTAAGSAVAQPTPVTPALANPSTGATPTPTSPTADGFRISIDPLLPVVNVLGGTLDVKS